MIRSSKGIVIAKGSREDILTDLAFVVRSIKVTLVEEGMTSDKIEGLINATVKAGLEDDEDDECSKNGKDAIDEAVDRLFDAILSYGAKGE